MIKVALAGFGVVGQGIWQILKEQEGALQAKLDDTVEVAAVVVRDPGKPRDFHVPAGLLTQDISRVLADEHIQVVLEATGDLEASYALCKQALRLGKHYVTANKALISRHMEELHSIAAQHNAHLLYEASVGGGIPVIKPLKDLLWLGQVYSVRGIINGSCNYVLHQMATTDREYTEVVAEAQQKGFLEADADDDLHGHDALRKLRILSTLAFGGRVDEHQVLRAGIDRVTRADMRALAAENLTVKLVGSARNEDGVVSASVFPHALPHDDPLAGVPGAFNYVEVTAQDVGRLGFFGSGAGRLPTAHAMVNDLVDIVLGRQSLQNPLGQARLRVDPGTAPKRFYVRGLPEGTVSTALPLGPGAVTDPMPLRDMIKLLSRHPQAVAILMSHDAR